MYTFLMQSHLQIFATNWVLASEVLVPWGNRGISMPSKHKFACLGIKQSFVTKILLPSMVAYPRHINGFPPAPQRDFFFFFKVPSNLGVCIFSLLLIRHWNVFPILLTVWRMLVVKDKNSRSKSFYFSLTWKQETESYPFILFVSFWLDFSKVLSPQFFLLLLLLIFFFG